MAKSPDEMLASMIANLREKTGRSLDEWVALAAGCGESKHGGIVKWLKSAHGMGHGYANMVAAATLKAGVAGTGQAAPGAAAGLTASGGDDLVDAQYAGKKAALRPIHDALIAAARALGKDVEVSPKKTCVSLRRSRQFALVQPSTATRVDLGLRLDGVPAKGRLELSGSWNSMVSHRVRLESVKDIDAEVKGWLGDAYRGG